jgi:hypothetical protein
MSYKISEHFSYDEFIESKTAKSKGIDNTPDEQSRKNIYNLVTQILEPVRKVYDRPIVISSGYRCKKLNTAVKGAINSDHCFGAAADIHSKSDTPKDNKELFDLIVKMAKDDKIKCRQIIDEYNYNWVHVSVNHPNNSVKNNQVLHIK